MINCQGNYGIDNWNYDGLCYAINTMNDFVNWLIGEMNKRGWTNSELARRAEVSQPAISMLISGQNKPGNDVCLGIARAFKLPPETVLRYAGILPPADDANFTDLLDYMRRLTPEERQNVMEYVVFRYRRQESSSNHETSTAIA